MARWVSAALAFITAASVLIMEIVATRLLAPYLGVTLQTYTAIIGTVLAGIATGAFAGGWLADRFDPQAMLGPVLVVGGGFVLASLGILRLVGERVGGGSSGAVVLSGLAFLLPAATLSMIAPMLIKMSMGSLDRAGREVGRIEALGTTGAIVGTFFAGFVLVARFRSDSILIGEGVFLLLLGAGLWASVGRGRGSGTRVISAALIAVALGGTSAAMRDRRCAYETRYFCVNIETDENRSSGRYLSLDTVLHSYVDLDDPTYLEFSYVKGVAAGVAALFPGDSAIKTLHVGGGGFTLPTFLNVTRPGSLNLVIERDPGLIKLDQKYLGLNLGGGLTAVSGDGRIVVRDQPRDTYDVVVGDAFGGEWVPWHLTTREFVADVQTTLRPGGLYAMNIIDSPPSKFVKAEVATVQTVFRYVAVASSEGGFGAEYADNFVVYASDSPLPLAALLTDLDRADIGWTVLSGNKLKGWVGSAQVLTDAFAPVEQLLTTSG